MSNRDFHHRSTPFLSKNNNDFTVMRATGVPRCVAMQRLTVRRWRSFYFENELGRHSAAKLLTKDKARRIAANIKGCHLAWASLASMSAIGTKRT
jgi:hypothetical protein